MLQFYYFHLMPWPYLPADFDRAILIESGEGYKAFYDPVSRNVIWAVDRADFERFAAEGPLVVTATETNPKPPGGGQN